MKIQYRLTCLLTLFCSMAANLVIAQQLPPVQFEFGPRQFTENVSSMRSLTDVPLGEAFNDAYYVWAQFEKLPSDARRQEMTGKGFDFIEYIPGNCYLLTIPSNVDIAYLRQNGLHVIQPLDRQSKIDTRIMDDIIPDYAIQGGNIKLKILVMPGANLDLLQSKLKDLGGHDIERPNHPRFVFLTATREAILNMSDLPWIRYIELMDPKGEPESIEGRSMQKANLLDNHLTGAGALSYNGADVKILVRDDGDVGPHIDFQDRLWNDPNNSGGGTHGDGVAGVWGATGNIDPTVVAGGSAADVYVIDYLSTFLDNTLTLHQDSGVVITNSSYSNGCNAGYTTTTVTLDEMVFDNPTLMHVFSAGNSNNNNCGYGAGDQWGNITGGHKQGKNVVTVANLGRTGDLESSSSRGPAHDGRIKPDLAGHGQGQRSTNPNNGYQSFGGTSAAAPSIAGNLTQLYEVYKDLNGGTTPPSALIKACAMNSAQDLGNAGPDFKYGWGLVHTKRAYDLLFNNQYLSSSITTGGSNTHSITVPAGVGQLRIMLYWPDPEASASAGTALVNDLDLDVDDPSSSNYLPHVLDHTPNAVTLDLPATPANAPDRLNNVEQVTINTPAAGTYTINIEGFSIPQGPQEYYVLYSFIPTGVELTYPLGGEKLVQGVVERVHWDAFGNTGTFDIDYTTNNGSTWIPIASSVAADQRSIDWTPPTITSADCRVRVSRGGEQDDSDENFNIHGVPTGLSASPFDIDSAALSWNSLSGTTSYYVYQLIGTKMVQVATTSSTSINVGGLVGGNVYWFSVSGNALPTEGQRSFAILYDHDIFGVCQGCLFSTTLPYEESFEVNLRDHCNFTGDDFDWLILSGLTPSSATGPPGAYLGDQYIYVEATNPNFPSKTTILGGPCFDMTSCVDAFMLFDYNMFGAAMGSLDFEVSTNSGASWSAPIWSVSGNQGLDWLPAAIDLTSYCGGDFTYRFVATTGPDFTSDMALDNILISEGQICNGVTNIITNEVNDFDARVSWQASVPAVSYDLELINTSAGGSFTGVPTVSGVMDTTYMFTGLLDMTSYAVYVRSNCGGAMSTWAGVLNFTTACSSFMGNTIPFAIDIMTLPYADTNSTNQACVSNQYNGQASPDMIYKVTTGSQADSIFIRTCNGVSDFDTYLFLLDENGIELAFNDDGICGFQLGGADRFSILNVPVSASTTYYIVVDGWSTSSLGTYALLVDDNGEDCPVTLTVNGTPAAGTYSTAGRLTSDALIENPKVINFIGGEVDLDPNFEVELGADFEADATGCP